MDPWQGNKLIIPSRPYVRMEERKSDQILEMLGK
jgi:hypothetical protein